MEREVNSQRYRYRNMACPLDLFLAIDLFINHVLAVIVQSHGCLDVIFHRLKTSYSAQILCEDGSLFFPESTRVNVSAPEGLFCSRLYPSLFVSQQNPVWISNVIAENYQAESVLNEVKI